MAKLNKQIEIFLFYFLVSIIVYIPFYRLIQGVLESKTNLSPEIIFWLIHWYEPIAIVSLLYCFIVYARTFLDNCHSRIDRPAGRQGRESINDLIKKYNLPIVIIVLFCFALISIIFFSPSISRGLEGFRFILFPLVTLFIAYFVSSDRSRFKKIVNIYLLIAIIAAIWGIAERFMPENYWAKIGLLASNYPYWYGSHKVVSVLQSVSFLGGANQLASYLLPGAIISFGYIIAKRNIIYFLSFMITASAIFLTFSRSAFLALVLTLIIYSFVIASKKVKFLIASATAVLLLVFILIWTKGDNQTKDLFTHGASQSEHVSALKESVEVLSLRIKEPTILLFGSGLGSAGPSAMKYGDGIVSESWYFEVFFSVGLIGTLLYLSFIFFSSLQIFRKNKEIVFALISVLICSLFLHTLSDNPAISLTMFILLGLVLKKDQSEKEI